MPNIGKDLSKEFLKALKKDGIQFLFGKKSIKGEIDNKKETVNVEIEDNKSGKKETLEADVCLVATGRKPYTYNLGLENIGLKTDQLGRI